MTDDQSSSDYGWRTTWERPQPSLNPDTGESVEQEPTGSGGESPAPNVAPLVADDGETATSSGNPETPPVVSSSPFAVQPSTPTAPQPPTSPMPTPSSPPPVAPSMPSTMQEPDAATDRTFPAVAPVAPVTPVSPAAPVAPVTPPHVSTFERPVTPAATPSVQVGRSAFTHEPPAPGAATSPTSTEPSPGQSGGASSGPSGLPYEGYPAASPPPPAVSVPSVVVPGASSAASAPASGYVAAEVDPEADDADPDAPPPPPVDLSVPVDLPRRPLPRVIAIANQKGGVGKTTTTVNLGAALAEEDHRTLVIDLDPQGNATTGLGIDYHMLEYSIYDVLLAEVPLDECIESTAVKNLFIAPASLDLAGAEIELVPAMSRELRLRNAINQVRDDYDYILIDCPPSLGLLTVNALAAADEVMVPIQCEYYALEGLGQLIRNINLVQKNLNTALELSSIVLVMYDGRTKLAEQVSTEVREHFGSVVCKNVIPRNIRLSEAPSYGQPITTFDPSSRGAVAYRELAREVHRVSS